MEEKENDVEGESKKKAKGSRAPISLTRMKEQRGGEKRICPRPPFSAEPSSETRENRKLPPLQYTVRTVRGGGGGGGDGSRRCRYYPTRGGNNSPLAGSERGHGREGVAKKTTKFAGEKGGRGNTGTYCAAYLPTTEGGGRRRQARKRVPLCLHTPSYGGRREQIWQTNPPPNKGRSNIEATRKENLSWRRLHKNRPVPCQKNLPP